MTAWLLTNVLPWLLAGLLALVAILQRAWRKADKQQRTIKDLETDAETRKRMDKADAETIGDDPAVLRDWLRERGKR
jgi:hypothetical protein